MSAISLKWMNEAISQYKETQSIMESIDFNNFLSEYINEAKLLYPVSNYNEKK